MPELTEPLIIHPLDPPTVEEEERTKRLLHRYDGIAIVAGIGGLLALAYSVRTVINPFVLLLLTYLILTPFREYRAAKQLLVMSGALFGIWFLYTLSGLLIPFIIGMVLAYLFNPLVLWLHEKKRVSRTWSSLAIVVIFTGILVAIAWIFLPDLALQTKAFIERLTVFAHQHANAFDQIHLRRFLLSLGLPANLVDQYILSQTGSQVKRIVGYVPSIFVNMIAGLPRFLERTLNMIIVPIAMFYFLKDWPKLGPLIDDLFPAKDMGRRRQIVENVDRVLYGYVRGQATVAAIVGILGAIAYTILGIPYAGLLGVILAVSDLIPIVGMIFSAFIVELVIFLTMELNVGVILSGLLVIAGLHLLEVYVIGPRIIGKGIGVPPILMILALLVFGYFLGFVGLLIAVPTTGIILLFVEEYRKANAEATEQ